MAKIPGGPKFENGRKGGKYAGIAARAGIDVPESVQETGSSFDVSKERREFQEAERTLDEKINSLYPDGPPKVPGALDLMMIGLSASIDTLLKSYERARSEKTKAEIRSKYLEARASLAQAQAHYLEVMRTGNSEGFSYGPGKASAQEVATQKGIPGELQDKIRAQLDKKLSQLDTILEEREAAGLSPEEEADLKKARTEYRHSLRKVSAGGLSSALTPVAHIRRILEKAVDEEMRFTNILNPHSAEPAADAAPVASAADSDSDMSDPKGRVVTRNKKNRGKDSGSTGGGGGRTRKTDAKDTVDADVLGAAITPPSVPVWDIDNMVDFPDGGPVPGKKRTRQAAAAEAATLADATAREKRERNRAKFRLAIQAAKQVYGGPEKQLVQKYEGGKPVEVMTAAEHAVLLKERRETKGKEFADKYGVTGERAALKAAEREYYDQVRAYQGKNVFGKMIGGEWRVHAAQKAHAEAALAFKAALESKLPYPEAGGALKWGIQKDANGETLDTPEVLALRAQRVEALRAHAWGVRESMDSIVSAKTEARLAGLDDKGKTAYGKAVGWVGKGPVLLYKGYLGAFNKIGQTVAAGGAISDIYSGKEFNLVNAERNAVRAARASRLIASAAVATGLSGGAWLSVAPLLALARGSAGLFAGIGAGKLAGFGYMSTFGKSGTEKLKSERRKTGGSVEDILRQQETQMKHGREARMKMKALIENIFAIAAGAGTGAAANLTFHELGWVHAHPGGHGRIPEGKANAPSTEAVNKVANLSAVKNAANVLSPEHTGGTLAEPQAVAGSGAPTVPESAHAPVSATSTPLPEVATSAYVTPTVPEGIVVGAQIHIPGEGFDQMVADFKQHLTEDGGLKNTPTLEYLRSMTPSAFSHDIAAAVGDKSMTMHIGDQLFVDEHMNVWLEHGDKTELLLENNPHALLGYVVHPLDGVHLQDNPVEAAPDASPAPLNTVDTTATSEPAPGLGLEADTLKTGDGASNPERYDDGVFDGPQPGTEGLADESASMAALTPEPTVIETGDDTANPVYPEDYAFGGPVDHSFDNFRVEQAAQSLEPLARSSGSMNVSEAIAQFGDKVAPPPPALEPEVGAGGGSMGVDEAVLQFGGSVARHAAEQAATMNAKGVPLMDQPHEYAMGKFNAFYGRDYISMRTLALGYLEQHPSERIRMPSYDPTVPGHIGKWMTEWHVDKNGTPQEEMVRTGVLGGRNRVEFDVDKLDRILR